MENYVVFDLETSKITPDVDEIREQYKQAFDQGAEPDVLAEIKARGEEAKNIKSFRPLGISCAAIVASNGYVKTYYPDELTGGCYADQLIAQQCAGIAFDLTLFHDFGASIITFNGLSFDFDILAEECICNSWREKITTLALNHVDLMFAFFCEMGYPVSLKAACAGMGLSGKLAGMDGSKAPVMWSKGREAQEKVLEYCIQDVKATAELYEAMVERGRLDWITKSGKVSTWECGHKIKTVSEALETPLPDTSWMTNPMTREQFYEWTNRC